MNSANNTPSLCIKISAVVRLGLLELIRRKDFYTALVLALMILIPLVTVNIFGVEGAVRYIREAALLLIWIFTIIISVTTGVRQMTLEVENKTILPLLARPIKRSEIILAKFFGAYSASFICLFVFYLLFGLISASRGGIVLNYSFFQAFILHAVALMIVVSFSITLSLLLTPSAANTISLIVCFGMLMFGQRAAFYIHSVQGFVRILGTVLYSLLPHLEFFDMRTRLTHEWGAVGTAPLLTAIVYGCLYTFAFLAVSCNIFKRRAI